MRIAQVICCLPPYAGGMGNSAKQIERLLGTRHEIVNFSPAELKPWLKMGHGAFLPQLLWKLRRFDYIYLHYPFFGTAEIIWLFKLFFRRPKLVIHYHMDVRNLGWLAKLLSLPSLLIRRSLLSQAETIVTASLDYIKNSQIKNYYQSHREKFTEIPFGIDINKYTPKALNQPAANKIMAKTQEMIRYINDKFIKKDRLDILFVGGLDKAHYFKGIDVLIRSLAGLKGRHWHLRIAGEGDLQSLYKEMASDYSLNKQIEFTDKLSDENLIRAYQNADLLILPSVNRNEAFGLVLIEAMACGVPVIASDLPGVRSVFENGSEGLLSKPGSADDLREKLEFILDNEEKRRLMAKAARQLAEEKYDEKKMQKKLLSLFIS